MLKKPMMAFLAVILGVSLFLPGCAPLLIGAGAVGGYEMATQNAKK